MIVDFPHRHRTHTVRFAKTSQLQVFESPNAARNELWYTKAEYVQMKLAIRRDVLAVRTSRETVGDDTDTSVEAEENVCLMGIEHLLSSACMNEVMACRARCIEAVLTEQARVRDASTYATIVDSWERIALASIAQTRNARLRARELGLLHQRSSWRGLGWRLLWTLFFTCAHAIHGSAHFSRVLL